MKVVDSSIMAAFVLREPGWEKLTHHMIGWTLDIAFLETLNAVIKALRRGKIDAEDARIMIEALGILKSLNVESSVKLLPRVSELALNSKLTAYDAAFLALAQEKTLPLVTLDRTQHEEAIRLGVPSILPEL